MPESQLVKSIRSPKTLFTFSEKDTSSILSISRSFVKELFSVELFCEILPDDFGDELFQNDEDLLVIHFCCCGKCVHPMI
jgi:hypothetical protein